MVPRNVIALGIESSCDDTAASVVTSDKIILSNIILSQTKEHSAYKGVVPEIASRAHMNYLEFAITEALKVANVTLEDIDCIAATGGPGLIGGVIVGTMFGKAIASVTKKPFIAVNHLEGHALTARLTSDLEFPYLLALLSGGHCQFLVALGVGEYVLLGQTLDDSLGEAFDKVAKMLGLDYPGGPIVESLAKQGDHLRHKFPRALCDRQGCDFSFSGLKTSVRQLIQNNEDNSGGFVADVCASFQYTCLKILEYKIKEAIKLYEQIAKSKKLVIAGGVAANQYLISNIRNLLADLDYELVSPPINLCTDNAAMIAWAGIERFRRGETTSLDFCPKARWNLF